MTSFKYDIMAVGAHPDDVEIGMGGTIAKYTRLGKKVVIVNLTEAELSSNGTVEIRQKEAENACEQLGIQARVQLRFPDRGLLASRQQATDELVTLIRQYRPRLVFAPFHKDRHPDHGHCGDICREAVFSATIKNYLPLESSKRFYVQALYYYQINGTSQPDFLIDISGDQETKYKALACFKSQFNQETNSLKTPLNSGYIDLLQAREKLLGAEAGTSAAEGFFCEKPPLIHDLLGDSIK
ncbi:bacillithiol biosynthesis deacetylase BshB1 [Salipaludibacillus agaradhaerens]|uniref:bacillithiol biosynthesis deacetylase BshB1 n=1 Tax=Salipaludibacillus agaradhaerens TaxID=76935 RepID=UPI00099777B4|nr:bacillithiol biosynthesis deacetylase BshB1 [Salipaludibacillus agaradhaerens]